MQRLTLSLLSLIFLLATSLAPFRPAVGQQAHPLDPREKMVTGQDAAAPPRRQSVKPGINDSFTNPELKVEEFIQRFEIESREIYDLRQEILERCRIQVGERIADVGAGTGLFTRQFCKAVGNEGWVFAVDIAPRFIEHINRQADLHGLRNVTGVICREDSVALPPDSVDVVFICDTYHHFEYPADTMASIHSALRVGGRMYLIDFERDPGVSREWILDHVRAGKAEVIRELESFGFEVVEELKINRMEDNYMLHLRKRPSSTNN